MKFPTGFVVAALVTGINASPISSSEADMSLISRATLDSALFARLKYYSQYSAAAYCNNNGESTGTPITCDTGNCPDVQAAAATSVLEFDDSLLAGIQGFVSTSSAKSEIVLSFRGSSTIRNYIADLNIALLSFVCTGCKVHAGFLTAWREPRTKVLAAIKAAQTKYPSYKLIVTGHSLGGAVATLAAADLRSQGIPADLFTYGSPRVGNKEFAEFVSKQTGVTARVTHTSDPVPRLPPLVLTPFRHTTPEYWLSNGASTKTNYVLSDVKICAGTANIGCNAGTVPSLDLDTHRYYFVWTSQCAPDLAFRKREEPMSPAVRRRAVVRRDQASDKELLMWMTVDREHGAEIQKREANEGTDSA